MILYYYNEQGNEYEYEVEDIQVRSAISNVLQDRLKLDENVSDCVIDYMCDVIGVEDKLQQELKDEITDYFRTEGEDYVEDCEEKSRNELGYVGMKEKDFI